MNSFLKAFTAGVGVMLAQVSLSTFADWLPGWVIPTGETGPLLGLIVLGVILGWFVPRHFLGAVAGMFAVTFVFGGLGGFLSQPPIFLTLGLIVTALTIGVIGVGWLAGRYGVIHFGLEENGVNLGIGVAILIAAMVSPPILFTWDSRHSVPRDEFMAPKERRTPRKITAEWTVRLDDRADGAPVAVRGRVFVTADGVLYAINSDGRGAWMLPKATTQPIIVGDRLYAAFESGLARIDPQSGATIWKAGIPTPSRTLNDSIMAYERENRRRLSAGASGVIYVNPGNETIYAINPDGSLRWSFRHNTGSFVGPPIEGTGGRVYAATQTSYPSRRQAVCAIDGNGQLVWEHRFPGSEIGPVAVDRTNRVYVTVSRYLFSLTPDGSERWRKRFRDNPYAPAIDQQGNVVIMHSGWGIVAPDGRARQALGYGGPPLFTGESTIIFREGLAIFGADGNLVEEFDPQPRGKGFGEVALGPDGMVYIQSSSALVAVQTRWRP